MLDSLAELLVLNENCHCFSKEVVETETFRDSMFSSCDNRNWPLNTKVLHMAQKNDHMEYSMCHEIVTIWSTPWGSRNKSSGALCISSTVDIVYNSMKHTKWPYISAIWITPYGMK